MDSPPAKAATPASLSEAQQTRLRQLPSMTELTNTDPAWLRHEPRSMIMTALRQALEEARRNILSGEDTALPERLYTPEGLLERARALLHAARAPKIQPAINATGIILHTGLGRAVFSSEIIDALVPALKSYTNLAVDRTTGSRIERDELIEPLLKELTGAEAGTVVNNNAGATLLVLAALAAEREVIVSRGQLIEIGGSFRLPDVMALSRAKLVEVGTTNRTHLKDYRNAVTDQTAALMRVHPSNYRVIGFTKEAALEELVELAHRRGLVFIDDLGAGALLDLRQFGLPPETLVKDSVAAGADVVLFSADKLIGGSQGGIIVGRKDCIDTIRKHPLMRALRVDKTCLMILERTLAQFRDPARLTQENPTYVMLTAPVDVVHSRAKTLAEALRQAVPQIRLQVRETQAYLGSGSLPEEALPSAAVSVFIPQASTNRLAEYLRLDPASVFGRIEEDQLILDVRTVADAQVQSIADAVARAVTHLSPPATP